MLDAAGMERWRAALFELLQFFAIFLLALALLGLLALSYGIEELYLILFKCTELICCIVVVSERERPYEKKCWGWDLIYSFLPILPVLLSVDGMKIAQ